MLYRSRTRSLRGRFRLSRKSTNTIRRSLIPTSVNTISRDEFIHIQGLGRRSHRFSVSPDVNRCVRPSDRFTLNMRPPATPSRPQGLNSTLLQSITPGDDDRQSRLRIGDWYVLDSFVLPFFPEISLQKPGVDEVPKIRSLPTAARLARAARWRI